MSTTSTVLISVVGGYVLGKAGDTVFGSDTAKKVYTKLMTGAFIAKDAIMERTEVIQAAASDIAADARIEADAYQAKKDARFFACMNDAEEDEAEADLV